MFSPRFAPPPKTPSNSQYITRGESENPEFDDLRIGKWRNSESGNYLLQMSAPSPNRPILIAAIASRSPPEGIARSRPEL